MRTRAAGILAFVLLLGLAGSAGAQEAKQAEKTKEAGPYQRLEFLLGAWTFRDENLNGADQEFRWCPGRSCIRWTMTVFSKGKAWGQHEGMFVWNPVTDKVEFLMSLEPNVMEKGEFEFAEDGSVVRHIQVYYKEGEPLPPNGERLAPEGGYVREYRQTFWPMGADEYKTSIYVKTEAGEWQASFPGSEDLVFKRTGAAKAPPGLPQQ